MRLILALGAITAMTACAGTMSEDAARDAARTVINPVVAQQVPGPSGVALSNCIIDNASIEELMQLAGNAGSGADAASVQLVSVILARPATVTCAQAALS